MKYTWDPGNAMKKTTDLLISILGGFSCLCKRNRIYVEFIMEYP
jgi:hypothetical protein